MRAAVALLAFTVAGGAQAASLRPVKPLDGYACMSLAITEAEAMNPHGAGVNILAAPSAAAPVGTAAPAIVFVRQPVRAENGFVEVMQYTGKPGWIRADRIKPASGMTRCVPSIMSDGKPGIG